MDLITSPEAWIAFATLTALELVLGIDNIIFISILVDKLSADQREIARRIGLFMAMFMRIGLLLVLSWIVGLVEPMFSIFNHEVSGRDAILLLGGMFFNLEKYNRNPSNLGRWRKCPYCEFKKTRCTLSFFKSW